MLNGNFWLPKSSFGRVKSSVPAFCILANIILNSNFLFSFSKSVSMKKGKKNSSCPGMPLSVNDALPMNAFFTERLLKIELNCSSEIESSAKTQSGKLGNLHLTKKSLFGFYFV